MCFLGLNLKKYNVELLVRIELATKVVNGFIRYKERSIQDGLKLKQWRYYNSTLVKNVKNEYSGSRKKVENNTLKVICMWVKASILMTVGET
jgi:hypothetical protein